MRVPHPSRTTATKLDPYFPNARRGWHKRPLREHCGRVLDKHRDESIEKLGGTIRSFLDPADCLADDQELGRVMDVCGGRETSSFAKRLITGKAAEHYFSQKCFSMEEFRGMELTDTTGWGCGFDFKLSHSNDELFHAVEVKGLRENGGSIQFTELEYEVANALMERYSLVIVRNFVDVPFSIVINNPVNSALTFSKTEREVSRVTWAARIRG